MQVENHLVLNSHFIVEMFKNSIGAICACRGRCTEINCFASSPHVNLLPCIPVLTFSACTSLLVEWVTKYNRCIKIHCKKYYIESRHHILQIHMGVQNNAKQKAKHKKMVDITLNFAFVFKWFKLNLFWHTGNKDV